MHVYTTFNLPSTIAEDLIQALLKFDPELKSIPAGPTLKWAKKYSIDYEKMKRRQEIRKSALSKLSEEELMALGINNEGEKV